MLDLKNLYMRKGKISHRQIRRWKRDRVKKGYCFSDLLDLESYYLELLEKSLIEFRDNIKFCPYTIIQDYFDTHPEMSREEHLATVSDKAEDCTEEIMFYWKQIIDSMITCFHFANPETEAIKNIYEDVLHLDAVDSDTSDGQADRFRLFLEEEAHISRQRANYRKKGFELLTRYLPAMYS